MTSNWWKDRATIAAAGTSVALVVVLDVLTNSIDTTRFDWDFRYYLDMAKSGMAQPLASPFAYRFLTPLLARLIAWSLGATAEGGFAVIAYVGAAAQLFGVYAFTRWYARSTRGAWLAMLVTAFSLFNVKFLLFDRFRPDHLAYPLILLQAYFALTGRFPLLVASTIVGCQIREFAAIPLIAYVYARIRAKPDRASAEKAGPLGTELVVAAIGLGIAVILPRLLIPVSADFQFAGLSRDGILRVLLAPFIAPRDFNFIFSLAAYVLPILMLSTPGEALSALRVVGARDRAFFTGYTVLVLAFSFAGGTDFFRFSTYLFLPQAVLLGLLADRAPLWRHGIALLAVFGFNRIWLDFPMSDLAAYLDFYGAHGTRLDNSSVLRLAEWASLVALGQVAGAISARRRGRSLPEGA